MGFVDRFNGTSVKPSQVSYEALTFSANTQLYWPTETLQGVPYVATQIDGTATAGGLSILMPNALQGATGQATIITNIGSQNFALTDQSGNSIAVLAPSQSWLITLTDNTTANGTWRALQLASTTSNAQASSLAGFGLQAAGTLLQVQIPTQIVSANQLVTAPFRANAFVWQGAIGTLQLDTIANLTPGWWALFKNEGTGALTISTSNSETMDGDGSLVLQPDTSAFVVCAAGGFNSFGQLPLPLPVDQGGTGATDANSALVNLGGTTVGIELFTAASVSAVLALLGLNNQTLTEATISTNQALTAASTQSAFVAIAPLTINLPVTTGLSKTFIFAVYAQGGAVTITPNIVEFINGMPAGTSFTVSQGTSALFTTDANGNWWPFYVAAGGSVTSVGLADASAASIYAISGSPVSGSGTLTLTLVTQAANYIFAGPTSGGAAQPTFRPMVAADIPSITSLLDGLGAVQGDVLYRNAANWVALAPGVAGQLLQTGGAGANPSWVNGGGGSGTVNAGVAGQLTYYGTSANVVSGNANATISAGALTLGVTGSTAGSVGFSGSTSGKITMQGQAAAGTYNFNLPITAGTAGQPLLSGGGGGAPMTFGTLAPAAGGTGLATLTAHAVLLGAGTANVAFAAPGTAGQALVSNGPAADPSFKAVPGTWTAGATNTVNPYVAATSHSVAHGLGAIPDDIKSYIQCLTAELGYSVGDRVYAGGSGLGHLAANNGYMVAADVTNTWVITNDAGNLQIFNKGTGSFGTITPANWEIVAIPYKIN